MINREREGLNVFHKVSHVPLYLLLFLFGATVDVGVCECKLFLIRRDYILLLYSEGNVV